MTFTDLLLSWLLILLFFQTLLIGFTMDSVRSIEKMVREYLEQKKGGEVK